MNIKKLSLATLGLFLIYGAYALVGAYSQKQNENEPSALMNIPTNSEVAQDLIPAAGDTPQPLASPEREPQTEYASNLPPRISDKPKRVPQNEPVSVVTSQESSSVPSSNSGKVNPAPVPTTENANQTSAAVASAPVAQQPVESQKPRAQENPELIPIKQLFYFWFGAGLNFLSLSQTDTDSSTFNFQGTPNSSYFFKVGGYVSKDAPGVEFSYKNAPGSIASSSTLTVTNSNYTWQTFAVEALFLLKEDPFMISKLDKTWTARLGVQQHFNPYLATQSASLIDVKQNSITNASLGLELVLGAKQKVRYEFLARYQHPIASSASGGNTYSAKPKLAFDGSVGLATNLSKNFLLGAYWYGQWNQYTFSYYDKPISTSNSGNQSLFYSSMEVRLGYIFE